MFEWLFDLPPLTAYLLIGVLCWTEAAFFLGFITPGELAVVTGGVLAARGQVEFGVLLGVVFVATLAGNATGFYLGRRWGEDVLEWAPLQRFLGRSIRKAQDFMVRRGEWAIVLGRVSTPTRIVVPFLAGASGLRYPRFVVFDLAASLLWAFTWISVGYLLGESWDVIREVSGNAAILVLILFVTAVVLRWITVRIAANQRRVQAFFRLTLRATGTQGIARALAPGFRWLGRRLHPGLAQGLSLTLCFLVLLGAVGSVGLIFTQTRAADGLALIDFPVLEWMSEVRTEDAVEIARSGLRIFDWPALAALAIPLMAIAFGLAGRAAAFRFGAGVIGAGGGANFLDAFVLEGNVPHSEYPSVAVAATAALLVHSTALTARVRDWAGAVACAGIGTFVLFTVALGTLVAGWAAPSGIALGLAMGMAWAAALELPWAAVWANSQATERHEERPISSGSGQDPGE
ncbi:MAG: DedA family protein [Candidatus Wenzhouxiangella sp. M2_3B_020]